MARIRTIKPEFFTSLSIASLPLEARLTFIGLWTHVDDEGRCVDDARLIKAALWPLDDRLSTDVELDLKMLSESSLITRYTIGARSFLTITNWREHQRINRPTKSKMPPPPLASSNSPRDLPYTSPPAETPTPGEPSDSPHARLTEDSPQERNREQGTGNRENPVARVREDDPAGTPGRAEQLVHAWMTDCTRRPPSKVVDAVGREVAHLLRDGIETADIRRGLEIWQAKGMHPSSLPSVVNQVMNAQASNVVALTGRTAKPSTTDQRVGAALDLAAKYAQEDPS